MAQTSDNGGQAPRPGGRLVRRFSSRHELRGAPAKTSDALAALQEDVSQTADAWEEDHVVGHPPNLVSDGPADSPAKAAADGMAGAGPVMAAERSLIGAILADNALFDVVYAEVRKEDLSDPGAAAAFGAISDILEGRVDGVRAADAVTVSARPGLSRYVTMSRLDSWAKESPTDVEVVRSRMQVVIDAAHERNLSAAVGKAQDVLSEDHRSLEDRATEIGKLLAAGDDPRRMQVRDIGDLAVDAIAELIERSQAGTTVIGVPTGFRELDALTAGLQGGQLIILAARPSVGKSALALCMGIHAAMCGYATVMASLEMGGIELSKRAIAVVSGVDASRLRVGALTEIEWSQAMDAAERLKKVPFGITDMATVDIGTLQSVCRKLHREGKLKLLIVDYLQIMKGNPKLGREQQISEISRGLKLIAKELNIPVLALSQLSREVEKRVNKRPVMSDLRESGAIEQDADVIMFIHREEVFNKDTLEKGVGEIIVAKQRSGSLGDIRTRYLKATTKFEDFEATPLLGAPEPDVVEMVDPLSDLLPAMRPRSQSSQHART